MSHSHKRNKVKEIQEELNIQNLNNLWIIEASGHNIHHQKKYKHPQLD